jgi:hypothetical protein
MNSIPLNEETVAIAAQIIWFEPPAKSLSDPIRFMAYAMTYAMHEEMRVIRRYVSDEDFKEALDNAPPGIIDPRSWAYWNSKMGRYPPPPLPLRRFEHIVGPEKIEFATPRGSAQPDAVRRFSLEEERRNAVIEWQKTRQQESPKLSLEEIRRQARQDSRPGTLSLFGRGATFPRKRQLINPSACPQQSSSLPRSCRRRRRRLARNALTWG